VDAATRVRFGGAALDADEFVKIVRFRDQ